MSRLIKYVPLLLCLTACSDNNNFNAELAWNELLSTLNDDYAYLDKAGPEFEVLQAEFRNKMLAAKTEQEFIDLSQAFLRSFRDPHLNMGPYDTDDYSVYPTGADMYAEYVNGSAHIIDVKADSSAFVQGLRPKMAIVQVDGVSIDDAIQIVTGRNIDALTPEQKNYALNIALGGKRYQPRQLAILTTSGINTVLLAASYDSINRLKEGPAVSFADMQGIGYIRFNNALGSAETVSGFREALNTLKHSKAFIIDLRNTPSGGNTGVAEPILGHFVNTEQPYQLYRVQQSAQVYNQAPLQQAVVAPQLPHIDKPFVALAGRWTGSMGEGMIIALDALGAKAVIGAPMADLLGGIKQVQLAASGAWLELGFERLYHVNGSFREDFVPSMLLAAADTDTNGDDPALLAAIELLNQTE